MRYLVILMSCLFLYISWPAIDDRISAVKDSFTGSLSSSSENQEKNYSLSLNSIIGGFESLQQELNTALGKYTGKQPKGVSEKIKKPDLGIPADQVLSVHNIEIGDSKKDTEQQLGIAKRSSYNEYGVHWNTYHQNYQNFTMAAYDENGIVEGLYSNQDLISSRLGIKHGISREKVLDQLGEPLTKIHKRMTFYKLPADRDYDLFHIDGTYITIFYDKHEGDAVTSIQIISERLENKKQDYYSEANDQLKEGFEYQLFDLTNAERAEKNLPILSWDEHIRETARNHSKDMAENNYFSHTNLEGQSPFDRMAEDDIKFSVAGENLAYGQNSSVFAHEGLMNSLGHRKNILQPDYRLLGIGVAFNNKSQPYYTENYYSKRY
ncbi:CAP-associated domain-containing protein [Mesobacillus zeae]|uniref:Serine protease n=1 Tax=Mesobacillus zeae TaxID=1917180 RepID=A0A398BGQ0_9BACI|nr:CAP-associated domain-containing protein [Mesobacillus zeae]RID88907.1 serine protease [Mesobacillus zeae]